MSVMLSSARLGQAFSIVILLLLGVVSVHAGELKLEAQLIWGTNDPKPPKPEHKPVDDATAQRLRKVFKWKSYFIVNSQTKIVPSRGSNRFKLSDDCTVEITELEGPKVEVKLIGKGVPVHKSTKELQKGEWFVYSGDDKNESAWFIIIRDIVEKEKSNSK